MTTPNPVDLRDQNIADRSVRGTDVVAAFDPTDPDGATSARTDPVSKFMEEHTPDITEEKLPTPAVKDINTTASIVWLDSTDNDYRKQTRVTSFVEHTRQAMAIATGVAKGLLSAADKTKLDGLEQRVLVGDNTSDPNTPLSLIHI